MMQKLIKTILFGMIVGWLSGCTEDRVYEQNYDFAEKVWPIAEHVQFNFSIDETNQFYQIFINLRHDADYPYRNIYFKYQLGDSTTFVMENTLVNFQLFSHKEGIPMGKANSNIISYQELLLDSVSFPHSGNYAFSLDQYMRTDSLKGIYSVGIKVVEQPIAAE